MLKKTALFLQQGFPKLMGWMGWLTLDGAIYRASYGANNKTVLMIRQVTERVNIENFQGAILMNRRNEMGGVRVDRVQYRRWGGD